MPKVTSKPPLKGYNPNLPSGYDVRDVLAYSARGLAGRSEALEALLAALHPVPEEWLSGLSRASNDEAPIRGMPCTDCQSYQQLVVAWRKALKWTEGLDHALAVMLASIASTKSIGDQLWIKVIAPAAAGKSTLCEALSVNQEYVVAKSTIRGFFSGWREEGDSGKKDCSLVTKVAGKTLIVKDGDTLLQSPNLPQILSEGRDLYDGTSRTHYRNNVGQDYSGIRMTWILCGTNSLRSIDSSELGERFLDCVIMEDIDEDLEDEILWRVVNRAQRNMSIESDGKLETHYAPELAEAMQMSGGYVGYLRENASSLLCSIAANRETLQQCAKLAKFISFMRARPSRIQDENDGREFSTRLSEQLIRLANCLAVVLNRTSLDEEVMRRVHKVALDTSRGMTLVMAKHLYQSAKKGLQAFTLATRTSRAEEKTRRMLRFLKRIGVAEVFTIKGTKGRPRWRLTDRMQTLYAGVME